LFFFTNQKFVSATAEKKKLLLSITVSQSSTCFLAKKKTFEAFLSLFLSPHFAEDKLDRFCLFDVVSGWHFLPLTYEKKDKKNFVWRKHEMMK